MVRRGRGSVLILALWALFFLGALALAIGGHVSGALRLARVGKNETAAYYAARAGVERAILAVTGDTNAWDTLTEPWSRDEAAFRDVAIEGGRYTVSCTDIDEDGQAVARYGLEDEESKVNLNVADSNLTAAVMARIIGLGPGRAAEMDAAIRAYRRQKEAARRKDGILTGAKGNGYPAGGNGSLAELQSLAELRLVAGFTGEAIARLEPYVTLYGSGYVNLNTAAPDVLRCLADASGQGAAAARESLVRMLIGFRGSAEDGGFTTKTLDSMWSALSRGGAGQGGEEAVFRGMQRMIDIRSSCFRGRVAGRAKGGDAGEATIEFVFDRDRNRKVCWREW